MTRQKKTTVCPLGGGGVGGKWKFWIMYQLLSGPKRFGELQRLFPQVSRQMLTIQLRELEQTGLLHRQVYLQVPPKVEYSLSEVGQCVEPIIRQMEAWGTEYSEQGEQEVDWLISLGGKWTFWIWYHLLSGPKRFGELQKLLAPISQHMLILKLRELEQMGVLTRYSPEEKSLKGEYRLSQLGQNAEPLLHEIYAWGRWACDQLGLAYDGPVMDETAIYARRA